MNSYLQVLKKYIDFNGRASRREYWVFVLYNIIFTVMAILLDNILRIAVTDSGFGPIYGIYALGTCIPALAVLVRRLHDVGKSGWMLFISLIPIIGVIWLIVLLAAKGNSEENLYGEKPKDIQTDNPISDEIILADIVWIFLITAFYGIFPRIYHDMLESSIFKIAQFYLPLVGGLLPFSLAFLVTNKSKRVLLIILGVLLFIYNIYSIIDRFI